MSAEWPPPDLADLASPEVFVRNSTAPLAYDGCDLYGVDTRRCEHGVESARIPPGGAILGGYLVIRPGAGIYALPDGGAIVGQLCAECHPGAPR